MAKRYFYSLTLSVITVLFLTLFPCVVYAEGEAPATEGGTSSAEQETQLCSIGEEQLKSAAKGAHEALKQVQKHYREFRRNLSNAVDNDGCDDLDALDVDGNYALYWGINDKEGAVVADKYEPGTSATFKTVQLTHFLGANLDQIIKDLNFFISRGENVAAGIYKDPQTIDGFLNKFHRWLSPRSWRRKINRKLRAARSCKPHILKAREAKIATLKPRSIAHSYLSLLSGKTPTSCTCDSQGNLLECVSTDKTFLESDARANSCKPMNEYMADLKICPTCGIFEAILQATQQLASGAFDQLASGLIKILGIAFMIFIGYQVLLAVASPATQTPAKLLSTLTSQGFKVAIAIILLSNPGFVYDTLISPIIYGGFEFGLELSGDDSFQKIQQYGTKYQQFDESNEVLRASFLRNIMGAVEAFNEAAATMPAIGRSMICTSFCELIWYVIPHFMLLFEGLIIFVFGMIILLSVGFYLLDSAITLGLVCCLMPLAIACWPFKITAKYTTVCWNFVMNIFFSFVMVGIIIKVTVDLTVQAIATGITLDELTNFLDTNNILALEDTMDIGGLQMLMLVICCMLASKMIKDTNSLANKFAPGAPTQGMGGQLGGLAASVVTSVAKKAMGPAGKALNTVGEASGINGAGRALKSGAKNMANKALGKIGMGKQAKSQGGRGDSGGGADGGSGGGASGGSGDGKAGAK